MPPAKLSPPLLHRWLAAAGSGVVALGGPLAPNLIASDLFAWLFNTEWIWAYRLVIVVAWVIFIRSARSAVRNQRAANAAIAVNAPGGTGIVEGNQHNYFVNQLHSKTGQAPIKRVLPAALTERLGNCGNMQWIERNPESIGVLDRHMCVAVIGRTKSGKTREAAEILRMGLKSGAIKVIYELTARPSSTNAVKLEDEIKAQMQLNEPAALFVDELDNSTPDELAGLDGCIAAMRKMRPNLKIVITAQIERSYAQVKPWLERNDFFTLELGDLTPDQRRTFAEQGARTLGMALSPAAADGFYVSDASLPFDIVYTLQEANDKNLALDSSTQVTDLVSKSVATRWSETRDEMTKLQPATKQLFDSLIAFVSAGVTPRTGLVRRYAQFLMRSVKPVDAKIQLADAETHFANYAILPVAGTFWYPEPLIKPFVADPAAARKALTVFLKQDKLLPQARLALDVMNLLEWGSAIGKWILRPHEFIKSKTHWPQWIIEIVYWGGFAIALYLPLRYLPFPFGVILPGALLMYLFCDAVFGILLSGHSKIWVWLGKFKIPNLPLLFTTWLAAQAEDQSLLAAELESDVVMKRVMLAEARRKQAYHLRLDGDPDTALPIMLAAVSMNPNDSHAHNSLGNVYVDLARYDEARSAYQRAIQLDPKLADPHNGMGNVYHALNRHDEALASYQRAIELNPNDAYPHRGMGIVYFNLARYDGALAAYQRAIQLDPKYAYPHNDMGNVYFELDRHDEALAAYQRAIQLDPKFVYPHNGMGDVYSDLARHEEALAAYQRAIQLDPKFVYAHNGMGNVYFDLARHDDALAAYQRAIELDPKLAAPHHGMGNAFHLLDRHDEALAAYQRAILFDPKFGPPQTGIGDVYFYRGQYDIALAQYEKRISMQPPAPQPHSGMGDVYSQLAEHVKALTAYQRAVVLDSQNGALQASLARAYRKLGDSAAFEKHMALARQTIDKQNNYYQACFYAIAVEPDRALDLLAQAIAKSPGCRTFARHDPNFESLRNHPRFIELTRV